MRRLLNFSTHPGKPELFNDDWGRAEQFLKQWEFDGFELYPTSGYPYERIPASLIEGLHLRFFVILTPIWRGDRKRLLEIFGDWDTVEHFYGGRDAECIVECYANQLDLAHRMGCSYVVFHPAHCELEYVYDWKFPWSVNDTLDVCAEVINAATAKSRYRGLVLFENLWWPGSFRLDSPEEYEYLISRVDYPRCGIVLDTGHLLNKNPDITDETEAAEYMVQCIETLGELSRCIEAVHLTRSLSGEYVLKTRGLENPYDGDKTFWERLDRARRHVENIDRHEAFESPGIAAVLEKADPSHVVFEFSYDDMNQWERKIAAQKNALRCFLWPDSRCIGGPRPVP